VRKPPGIYVEILIQAELSRVWQLTQNPDQHERWDLRFTRIHYLPRKSSAEPQRFLYETRLGFGLGVAGTGESVGERAPEDGDVTSSLKFASDDRKSLIRTGAGYWKYIPTTDGLRFFTWYDYTVRFGMLGRVLDRFAFRPLIGWATAWSFDRLRLWVEGTQSPEVSLTLFLIHAVARLAIAFIWIWQGLVPKLLYNHVDELRMLTQAGLSPSILPWIGAGEVLAGVLILCTWTKRVIFVANAALMIALTTLMAAEASPYLAAAFNPITLNAAMFALAIVGWFASARLPSARNCKRVDPRRQI
jgi:hypothetical protein